MKTAAGENLITVRRFNGRTRCGFKALAIHPHDSEAMFSFLFLTRFHLTGLSKKKRCQKLTLLFNVFRICTYDKPAKRVCQEGIFQEYTKKTKKYRFFQGLKRKKSVFPAAEKGKAVERQRNQNQHRCPENKAGGEVIKL